MLCSARLHPRPRVRRTERCGRFNRGAKEAGLRAEDAASAAASGAIKGAGEVSATAGEQVRRAVTGVIAGVKVVVKEPVRSARNGKALTDPVALATPMPQCIGPPRFVE